MGFFFRHGFFFGGSLKNPSFLERSNSSPEAFGDESTLSSLGWSSRWLHWKSAKGFAGGGGLSGFVWGTQKSVVLVEKNALKKKNGDSLELS